VAEEIVVPANWVGTGGGSSAPPLFCLKMMTSGATMMTITARIKMKIPIPDILSSNRLPNRKVDKDMLRDNLAKHHSILGQSFSFNCQDKEGDSFEGQLTKTGRQPTTSPL
jgi:hypothetical protein